MKLLEYLESAVLLEGGAAIKSSSKVTQAEARALIPDLLVKVMKVLKLPKAKIKAIGSAGNKPNADDMSGDIDIAVEIDRDAVEKALPELAYDGKSYKAMKGINIYSFGAEHGKKIVQIDLMPVDNIKYAEWAYQANPTDLQQGLKGAQRNELFFAIAKHAYHKVLKTGKDGKPLEVERYFYDLGKGLMSGVQTRAGKKKDKKNFTTTGKKIITNDPAKITKLLFGAGVKPSDVATFNGALAVIKSDSFPYPEKRDEILDMARKGIVKKGLKVPKF